MTTRRSFLKTVVAAFLGALLPLHLLVKPKEEWHLAAFNYDNARREVYMFLDGLYLGVYKVGEPDNGNLIDFSENTVELTPDLSFQDLEGSFTMTIPLDRRYWIDGTPVES